MIIDVCLIGLAIGAALLFVLYVIRRLLFIKEHREHSDDQERAP